MKSKNHYMVGERPSQVGNFVVSARPASKLRQITYDIFPYWQGSVPVFEISFEALWDIDKDYHYLCAFEYSNGQRSKPQWQIQIPKLRKGKIWKTPVNEATFNKMHLVFTGDTFLIVAEVMGEREPKYESVYLFHVTNRSWLSLALLAGTIAGGLSILGNWLLNL